MDQQWMCGIAASFLWWALNCVNLTCLSLLGNHLSLATGFSPPPSLIYIQKFKTNKYKVIHMVVSQEYGFHLKCSAGEGWSHQLHDAWFGFHPEQALMTEQGRKNIKLCQKIKGLKKKKNKKKYKNKKEKCCDKPKGRKNLSLMVFPSYQFGYYSCSPKDQFVPMKRVTL